MPAVCEICGLASSKYVCSTCKTTSYCSVACYRQHRDGCAATGTSVEASATTATVPPTPATTVASPTLRPLASLRWPYVPDDATRDDPLKRDDPKPLTLAQFEAIATSSVLRQLLRSHPSLCTALVELDALRGSAREDALQRALGIDTGTDTVHPSDADDAVFQRFAAAIEAAVRGGREDVLGLDWTTEDHS